MSREVFTKLLFCWKILVCVFLLSFEIWFCQLGDDCFLLVDHQFEVEEVFLLREKNAPEVFSFHLSLSLEAPIWQLNGADQ
jgi:hypothetical protein